MRRAEEVLAQMSVDRKRTQTAKVLRHLLTHKKGITSMTAFEKYHATRLAVIISDLRHKYGVGIRTIRETTADGQTYARYVLEEGGEESA